MKVDNRNSHYIWMDILNVLATLCVILLHCSNDTVHHWDGTFNMAYLWGIFTHTVALWAVPVFLMLSGANLIGYDAQNKGWKAFYIRRFKRIGIPFLAWSLFYFLKFILKPEAETDLTWQDYITMFINGKYNGHMWFFVPLFALYLTIPFFNAFFRSATNNTIRWMVYFAFIFCSLLPFVFNLFEIDYFTNSIFPLGSNYLIYGFLGYIFVKTDVFKTGNFIYKLGIISALIQFFGTIIVMNGFDGSQSMFISTIFPTCFFVSIAVFTWAKEHFVLPPPPYILFKN